MRYAFLLKKRTGLNISDNASSQPSLQQRRTTSALAPRPLPLSHELAPIRAAHRFRHAHKKAAMRTAKEPMLTAAERKGCPRGWAFILSI